MSEEPGKYDTGAWRKGNKNAKLYDREMDERVTFRCNSEDKKRWQEMASDAGKSLNEWANETLNNRAVRLLRIKDKKAKE